jgi:predicted short-subunit dehydrogenase-like oxidoreductase (DUF2520 family)
VTETTRRAFALVGPGRAGTTISLALATAGHRLVAVAGRRVSAASTQAVAARLGAPAVSIADVGRDADVVVIATPDAAIEAAADELAAGLQPDALVLHLSGARGLDALAALASARPDVRIGALHPLQTLPSARPDAAESADVLRGAWAAVCGPDEVAALAIDIGLAPFHVADADRPRYHAAACVASNHLVALLGQVARIAADAGVPGEAFAPLVRRSIENAFAMGPTAALTGPVARGDVATVEAHLESLPEAERATYRAVAAEALRLSQRDDPALHTLLETPVAEPAGGMHA